MIGGTCPSDDRIKRIVRDNPTSKTRSEEEIADYSDVLAAISTLWSKVGKKQNYEVKCGE